MWQQGGRRIAYRICVSKLERKGPVERSKHRRCNIEMNIGEIRHEDVKLIDLAEGRNRWQTLLKKVMKQGLHKQGKSVDWRRINYFLHKNHSPLS